MASVYGYLRTLRRSIPIKLIWSLVWPQTVMMLCTLSIGLTDIWVAGRIDSEIQATIGLATQVQAFMNVLGMALGAGAMAAVSQSIGACRWKRAKRYAGLVLAVGACMGIVLALAGFVGRGALIHALQVPDNIRPMTEFFLSLVLLALPFQYIFLVGGTLFRATRNVLVPLFIVSVGFAVNVVGDLGFGLGWFGLPAFGVDAIAWSTFAAMFIMSAMTMVLLGRANMFLRGIVPAWRWMRVAAPYLLKVALPAMLSQFLWQTGYMTLFGITAALPDSAAALAGLTAGMRIEGLLFMPGVALNVTASILVGNALGAGDKVGAKRIGLVTVGTGVVVMSLFAACMWPWMQELAEIFSPASPAVQANIVSYLTYNILSTPFTVGGMILNGVMTGAGATIYSLLINSSSIWLVRLPLGWYLAHVVWGNAKGVFVAMLISIAVQALCLFWIFLYRDWTRFAMGGSSAHSRCQNEKKTKVGG